MIKVKGKVLRNEQEQVLKNMKDIEQLMKNKGYYGPYSTLESIPEEDLTPNWIYLIGDDTPYQAYLYQGLDTDNDPVFVYLGYFPLVGPQGPAGEDGTDGTNGITPHIGGNGNWFIGDQDTGVHAQGPAGEDGTNGTNGTNGITPHIGGNGNWFIGDQDTGVHAQGPQGEPGVSPTIYIHNIEITAVTNSKIDLLIHFKIFTQSDEQMSLADIKTYLSTRHTGYQSGLECSGYFNDDYNDYLGGVATCVYYESGATELGIEILKMSTGSGGEMLNSPAYETYDLAQADNYELHDRVTQII